MTDGPTPGPYRARWYRHRISTYWWVERWSYFGFILREVSSVFVAWLVVFLLMVVRAVAGGEASYRALLEWARTPTVLALNLIAIVFVLIHAVTWFNLAPKAMVVHAAGRRVPGALVAASNYGAWVVVSVLVAWLVLRR